VLQVVALGSSSTAGVGATAPANAYPNELQLELAAHFGHSSIRVLNRGVPGDTYRQMLDRLDRDVLAFHPDLVIWQVGTNAVINENGVAKDGPPIRKGVERLKAAGADVILMNPQYSPLLLHDPDCPVMLDLIDEIGRDEHVPVFHRFAVMHEWLVSGTTTFATILAPDGLHMNDLSHRCIGDLLADAIAEVADHDSEAAGSEHAPHLVPPLRRGTWR
jgi:lysophospholipase L1-like esterase